MGCLLDTHVWTWTAIFPGRNTTGARQIMASEPRYISAISFYEVGLKVRLGKWEQMRPIMPRMADLMDEQGITVIDINPDLALRASLLDWPNRDTFDRIIAVTALAQGLTLISADAAFDTIAGLRRLW